MMMCAIKKRIGIELTCPAVSQICNLTVFLSILTVRNRKSTPIVEMYDSVNASSWNRNYANIKRMVGEQSV
jgi:hypothetical protein